MMDAPADTTAPEAVQIADKVPRAGVAADEIGFSIAERYNAAAILFDNLENGNADRPAILSDTGRLTYAALCRNACRVGNALLALGLSRGDRVLLLLDDTPDYPAAVFGAIRAGLVPVLVNTQSPPDLIAYFIEDAEAKVCVTQSSYLPLLTEQDWEGTALLAVIAVDDTAGPSLQGLQGLSSGWLDRMPDRLSAADTHRDDMAFWMYSSGSTGKPKAVVHLQHDMLYTAKSYADGILGLDKDDICFSVPKIFFAYGFGNSLTFPFYRGAAGLLFAGRPTPEKIFEQVAKHRPTFLFALPTVYTALIKSGDAEKADLGSVRRCISAAEILSQDVFNAWEARFGHRIVEGLGSTEVLHIYLSNRVDRQKPGSAGLRVPGYEMKLTDREGNPVAEGEEGILSVRGDSSAPCYWNRPDKTAETMRDGWIWTGDRFTVDEDGFYYFKGRADDLIKVSGQWVYPLEVELCLNEHPMVRESAVMGAPLPDGRTTLLAVASRLDSEGSEEDATQRLQTYVKDTLMPYKYPRHIYFLDDLPKTGTGKIDRQALLALWRDRQAGKKEEAQP